VLIGVDPCGSFLIRVDKVKRGVTKKTQAKLLTW
jgi:hypothetical protein